jgi:hypothetical protein
LLAINAAVSLFGGAVLVGAGTVGADTLGAVGLDAALLKTVEGNAVLLGARGTSIAGG